MRTDNELRGLVEDIHGSPSRTQETNWVEWKNHLDITTPAGKFAVAKAIIGFSNRSVEQASRACEGVAYVVIGVEPGAADGVARDDHAKLDQGLKTFVDGPRFHPFDVPFSDVTVLVVVVEPPRAGDRIHTLQKEFDKYRAGTIFHRGAAQSEPASPSQVRMLEERLLGGVRQQDIDLTLRGAADPLTRISVDQKQLDDWLHRHEAYVRANSGKPPNRPAPRARPTGPQGLTGMSAFDLVGDFGGSLIGGLYTNPEETEEFEKRLEGYMAKMRRLLLDHVVRDVALDDDVNTVHFHVGNETDDPVSAVQQTVRIPKGGLLVYTSPPRVDDLPPLPKWPDALDRIRGNALAAALRSQPLDFYPHSGSVVETADAFEVTWDVGDIRPRDRSPRDFTITVITGLNAPEQISVELIARAMDRRGTQPMTVPLTVCPDTWTIDDFYDAEPKD
jgi:hypothetical protein